MYWYKVLYCTTLQVLLREWCTTAGDAALFLAPIEGCVYQRVGTSVQKELGGNTTNDVPVVNDKSSRPTNTLGAKSLRLLCASTSQTHTRVERGRVVRSPFAFTVLHSLDFEIFIRHSSGKLSDPTCQRVAA
eukprot:965445-Rhodomonas_salina.1